MIVDCIKKVVVHRSIISRSLGSDDKDNDCKRYLAVLFQVR